MALSARLNTHGKCSAEASMKSTTRPRANRSTMLPSAPPMTKPRPAAVTAFSARHAQRARARLTAREKTASSQRVQGASLRRKPKLTPLLNESVIRIGPSRLVPTAPR